MEENSVATFFSGKNKFDTFFHILFYRFFPCSAHTSYFLLKTFATVKLVIVRRLLSFKLINLSTILHILIKSVVLINLLESKIFIIFKMYQACFFFITRNG